MPENVVSGGFWFSWLETDELQKLPFEQVTSFAGMSELTAFLSVFSGYTLFSFSGKFQSYIYQYRQYRAWNTEHGL